MTLASRQPNAARFLRTFTILAVCGLLAIPALAQAPVSGAPPEGGLITAPEQLRRAEPPSKDSDPAVLENQGDEFRREKAYADALDYYSVAYGKAPSPILQNKMGIVHLHMMRDSDAQKAFERALKLDKNYAEAFNNLGVVHYRKRNFRRAIRNYEKAIKLKPDTASFYSNLGTAQFAREKYDDAIKSYLHALELDPGIFERRSTTGVSAYMAYSGDKGAKYHFVIAKMYARANDPDRALLYLRKALEEGYPEIKEAYKLEEFAKLRKDPRFEQVMQQPVPGTQP